MVYIKLQAYGCNGSASPWVYQTLTAADYDEGVQMPDGGDVGDLGDDDGGRIGANTNNPKTLADPLSGALSPVNIYPNPTSDFIDIIIPQSIAPKNMQIVVRNFSGNITQVPMTINGSKAHLDATRLASGLYLIVIGSGMKQYTGKFIKQ